MFCAATGFAGTPKVGTGRFEPERLVPVDNAVRIKVHFNADKSEQLPWTFKPQQKYVSVLPGETSLAFYTAKNISNKDIIGIATYNVTPDRVSDSCVCLFTFVLIGLSSSSRSLHISPKSNVSVSKNNVFLQAKKLTCLSFSSSTKIFSRILPVGVSKMSYSPTLFSGIYTYVFYIYSDPTNIHYKQICSARRNERGHLEPDAAEDVVQNSLGFGGYELAPKSEHRKEGANSSPSSS